MLGVSYAIHGAESLREPVATAPDWDFGRTLYRARSSGERDGNQHPPLRGRLQIPPGGARCQIYHADPTAGLADFTATIQGPQRPPTLRAPYRNGHKGFNVSAPHYTAAGSVSRSACRSSTVVAAVNLGPSTATVADAALERHASYRTPREGGVPPWPSALSGYLHRWQSECPLSEYTATIQWRAIRPTRRGNIRSSTAF